MGYLLNLTKAATVGATEAEREEIRQHLARLLPGEDHADFAEAFALAVANPRVHLEGLRLSHPPKAAA
jgi:Holliday junction resolvasome RuvABC endonuclease subunit